MIYADELIPETTYYCKIYSVINGKTYYSDVRKRRTKQLESISAYADSFLGMSLFGFRQSIAEVNKVRLNYPSIEEAGICYIQGDNVTPYSANNKLVIWDGINPDSFTNKTSIISGFNLGSIYTYWPYAKINGDYFYGEKKTLTTKTTDDIITFGPSEFVVYNDRIYYAYQFNMTIPSWVTYDSYLSVKEDISYDSPLHPGSIIWDYSLAEESNRGTSGYVGFLIYDTDKEWQSNIHIVVGEESYDIPSWTLAMPSSFEAEWVDMGGDILWANKNLHGIIDNGIFTTGYPVNNPESYKDLPTKEDWQRLINNCTAHRFFIGDNIYYLLKAINGNSLILPSKEYFISFTGKYVSAARTYTCFIPGDIWKPSFKELRYVGSPDIYIRRKKAK